MKRLSAIACAAWLLAASLTHAQGSANPAKPATNSSSTSSSAAKAAPATTAAKAAPAPAKAPTAALVDLNSATKDQLVKLPGIGDAIAAKIIAGRPWANKSQLLSKGLVTKSAYDKFSPLVVAKQAK